MLDEALGDDLRHDLVGVVDALASGKAQGERELAGEVGRSDDGQGYSSRVGEPLCEAWSFSLQPSNCSSYLPEALRQMNDFTVLSADSQIEAQEEAAFAKAAAAAAKRTEAKTFFDWVDIGEGLVALPTARCDKAVVAAHPARTTLDNFRR